ncbi:hypothetical protein Tcan_00845, partial [Toxocara canis]
RRCSCCSQFPDGLFQLFVHRQCSFNFFSNPRMQYSEINPSLTQWIVAAKKSRVIDAPSASNVNSDRSSADAFTYATIFSLISFEEPFKRKRTPRRSFRKKFQIQQFCDRATLMIDEKAHRSARER